MASKYQRDNDRTSKRTLERIKANLSMLKNPNAHQLSVLKTITAKLSK